MMEEYSKWENFKFSNVYESEQMVTQTNIPWLIKLRTLPQS